MPDITKDLLNKMKPVTNVASIGNEVLHLPNYSGIKRESIKTNPAVIRWLAPYYGGFSVVTTSQTSTAGTVLLALFEAPARCIVDQIVYVSGTTASGSVVVGIYGPVLTEETALDCPLVVESASTLQSGTSVPQAVTIAATSLAPGRYYVAFEGEGTGQTYMRHGNQPQVIGWGLSYVRGGGYGALTNPCPTPASSNAMPGIKIRVIG